MLITDMTRTVFIMRI